MARPGQNYSPQLFAWNLGDILLDIGIRAGVPYDRIEADQIEGYVEGFSLTCSKDVASAIETLSSIYFFDVSSRDGIIHFVPRGGNPVATITTEDMVDEGKGIESDKRKDNIEIPKVVNLEYFDTDGGLTPDMQTSDRGLDSRSTTTTTTETTVIMRADDAKAAVVIGHKVSIEELRGEVKFSLPDSFIELTESDVIVVNGQRMRITEVELDDGKQNYVCKYDRRSAYDTSIKGLPIVPPSEPPSLIIGDSVIEIIDSHIISGQDDYLGYYVAVSSKDLNWTGASVEISKDGGATWIDGDSTTSNAIIGKLVEPLNAHTPYYPDYHNVLTVELLREDMELITASFTDVLNRANLAIIGNELINFEEAEQISETTWELRGLLRGRKGSASVAHTVGERFVLMDSLDITYVPAELFELGRQLTFRVTSFGTEPTSETVTITYIGRSQIERAPAYLMARRAGANLEVSWQGVGRLGGGSSVGMGAYFTGYRVNLGSTTINTTEQQVTIPYSSGILSVRQINSITGQGPAATMTV